MRSLKWYDDVVACIVWVVVLVLICVVYLYF